jgi:pSer/pThr/pTyr-binding forkhead associated (FHA) protein
MNVTLIVTEKATNDLASVSLAVNERISIGRYLSSPIPLQGIGLSRDHFALESRDGALLVEDLSTNGTWLNGQRLSQNQVAPARSGDVIEVPGYALEISAGRDAARSESSSLTDPGAPNQKTDSKSWIRLLILATSFFSRFETALIVSALLSFMLIAAYVAH